MFIIDAVSVYVKCLRRYIFTLIRPLHLSRSLKPFHLYASGNAKHFCFKTRSRITCDCLVEAALQQSPGQAISCKSLSSEKNVFRTGQAQKATCALIGQHEEGR